MTKKRLLAILLAIVITAGSVFGVAQIAKAASRSTVMVIPVSSISYGSWWWNGGSTLEGMITADATQNVYVTSTQSVEEVCVEEGQMVREGDVLMTYDTTQTGINLEREKLSREQTALQIEVAKRNIETLKKLTPVPEDNGGWDIIDEPIIIDEPEEEPKEITAKAHDRLDDKAVPYSAAGEEEAWGTEENPYRFLCKDGAVITASFFEMMKKKAGGKDLYYVIELREGNTLSGALVRSWMENASMTGEYPAGWEGEISLAGGENIVDPVVDPEHDDEPIPYITPTPGPTDEPTPTPGPTDGPTPTPGPTDGPTPTPGPTDGPTPTPEPTDEPEPTERPSPTAVPEPTDKPDPGEDPIPSAIPAPTDEPEATSLSFKAKVPVLQLLLSKTEAPSVRLLAAESNSRGLAEAVGLIPSDAQYTREELARALRAEEARLKGLELDLREAELKISAAERALGDGTVKAKINGVVKKAGDPENVPNDGSAFIEVAAAEGLYIRSALNEKAYGHVKEGGHVTVTSWMTGTTFDGVIREISEFPDSSGMFGYNSATETGYPMMISVAGDTSGLNTGEWVQITLNTGSSEEDKAAEKDGGTLDKNGSDSTLTLPKAFIRDGDSGKYVFIRGEDGKLVKRAVTTGPLKDEAYEILEGMTNDDWIAFPYGKSVKEGAKTREGTMEELYES